MAERGKIIEWLIFVATLMALGRFMGQIIFERAYDVDSLIVSILLIVVAWLRR